MLKDDIAGIIANTSRENANIGNSPAAKMLQIASAASREYYLDHVIPEDISNAHRSGDIHIHDLDYYGKTLTCIHIPLGRLLQEGFDAGNGYVRPPKRSTSAFALAAIILQSCQNDMHGGQSYAHFDRDMAPYIDDDAYQAMEGFIFNLNTMHSRAGAQVPFSTVNVGCDTSKNGREVTRLLLEVYEKGLGRGETPLFPNIIFRVKNGVNFNPGDPNYDLFQLACRVCSRRMNPTFSFMDATFNAPYGSEVAYMGCRTRVIANKRGPAISDGRGNLSFTTINLPRLALKSCGDIGYFFELLREAINLTVKQLMHRFEIQSQLRVRDMPFLMGQELYLDSGYDPIGPTIANGTLSIGFIGLAETLRILYGSHHGEGSNKKGLEIVLFMRQIIDHYSRLHDLNFTLLATPAEGLSGRFVKLDREQFGIIPGVTDKNYYTNSFHLPVDFKTTIAHKLEIEGQYHRLTNAGHISYVELSAPPVNNPEAIESIVRQMYASNIGYGGINFPIDECRNCGYSGLIEYYCPKCRSFDISKIRRITGYLAPIDRFNDAKRSELRDRTCLD